MKLLVKCKIIIPIIIFVIAPFYMITTRKGTTGRIPVPDESISATVAHDVITNTTPIPEHDEITNTTPIPEHDEITNTTPIPEHDEITNTTATPEQTTQELLLDIDNELYCYKATNVSTIQALAYDEPPKERSIFFHETSCNSYKSGSLFINNRQACAVESAALMNPNSQVFLLYISPGVFPNNTTESHRYLEALQSYPNLKIRHVNYGDYVRGTAVEHLYNGGIIERSGWPVSHASDVLRYLTLWRFGGVYLDLDVVVIKSLEDLPPNYTGAESAFAVAAGVLSFASTGAGHQFATECLEDLQKNFNGSEWASNGPGLVTRFFQRKCNISTPEKEFTVKIKPGTCQGYTVYPPEYFYPVHWSLWEMFFRENDTEEVYDMTRNSYTIHLWNQMTEWEKAPVTSTGAYVSFAKQFCPKVFAQCDSEF